MADFRRRGQNYDPTFTVLKFSVVVFVDLYGGGDPSLPNPARH
jgi:hypothetical protein